MDYDQDGEYVLFTDSQQALARVEKLNSSLITSSVLHVKEKEAINDRLLSALKHAEELAKAVEFWRDQCISAEVRLLERIKLDNIKSGE